MNREYKQWNIEKKLIPEMIRLYCLGKHKESRKEEGVKGKELCSKCEELAEYAEFRLEMCPFKKNKGFCSFCKIHCYKPEYRAEMKAVMRYSGSRMLFSHPIFALSHVVAMIRYKKEMKKNQKDHNDATNKKTCEQSIHIPEQNSAKEQKDDR